MSEQKRNLSRWRIAIPAAKMPACFVLVSPSTNAYHIEQWKGDSGTWYARQTYDATEARVFDTSIESDCINAVMLCMEYGYTVKAVTA